MFRSLRTSSCVRQEIIFPDQSTRGQSSENEEGKESQFCMMSLRCKQTNKTVLLYLCVDWMEVYCPHSVKDYEARSTNDMMVKKESQCAI
ncbi:hypothetical protein TNIN_176921 [Trichonephila inaurata madagascariensis]|uniref:Uncharacterized protein n=1 Tax=Trichonephila inaurata madagascariensis TaxID=2747483 RepID=A0A8X7CBJ2_9ARAC|nr:hypothetical protein TNIN_176921 [Trichonephila inaurata madagascariensis]